MKTAEFLLAFAAGSLFAYFWLAPGARERRRRFGQLFWRAITTPQPDREMIEHIERTYERNSK